ncbi:MAG TPA: SpvB/TcaC N-terminal domain-containing protein, partial [Chitinophagaceae bacterium]|nr:SpvB/TcaC N-terminal domain-containing protein [Chitinophagaceae bacterium]
MKGPENFKREIGQMPDYLGEDTSFTNKPRKDTTQTASGLVQIPSITLPRGGGAIKGIDEKFQVNAANGTAAFSIPLPLSKTRSDFSPALSLSYDSGSGNSCFGMGWSINFPSIQRRTDQQLPLYQDADESDVFMLTGVEDLVPLLEQDNSGDWIFAEFTAPSGELVRRYRPRIEKNQYRIERITPQKGVSFYWRTTSANNVVTIYGRTGAARISDPKDDRRVFRWLPELSFDDRGNCMEFEYVQENLVNVVRQLPEQNRFNGNATFANAYLKRVKYGNKTPYQTDIAKAYNPDPPAGPGYIFEVVFDFGDHDTDNPDPQIQRDWSSRLDAFSDRHACFEVRTYRLCQRILFFHYFKELNNGVNEAPCLVRSLNAQYRYFQNPAATPDEQRNAETDYIISLQQFGYKKNGDGYSKKSWAPMEFGYREMQWNTAVQNISPDNLVNAPVGIGANYQWLDLWNEGISGILSEQGNGWFYKSNLGGGNFSMAAPVLPKPSLTGLQAGLLQLQDLEADGRKFIVSLAGNVRGYFELSDDHQWQPFRSFDQMPVSDLNDANTKFIDLNGDGRPDIIVSEENVFAWYASKGMAGYDAEKRAPKPFDEEKGPAMVFNDPEQSIFLADMSGDGMTDIVRIRNGEICYWPHLGYGKFGAKVNMDFAPVFDSPDLFNPTYLHLADISGTGATDILYLGKSKCKAWINLSGNAWSKTLSIDGFPDAELPNRLAVLDFLGNGTACIVWSSSLPANINAPWRYIDLMGGKKPYLLNAYKNNFGKELSWEYKSSTSYYLEDKKAGTPWITKLPFPVQCVSKVMINDKVAGTYFTNEYTYHHGYYDHPEKEFRGFGRVDQTDTEDAENFKLSGASNVVEEDLHQPPVKTVTWFHTGAFINEPAILNQFEKEYNKGPFEFDLPQHRLPAGLSPAEYREALRACKGTILRQEVYSPDGTALQTEPYSVAMHNYLIRLLQPRQLNRHAILQTQESEAVNFYYERDMNDPRIAHTLNIETDAFGNVLKSASVVYGRKTVNAQLPAAIQQEQERLRTTFTENGVTNYFDQPDSYRIPQQAVTKMYELTGLSPLNGSAFQLNEMLNAFLTAAEIGYEVNANNTIPQKRLIEEQRIIYLSNDLVTPLPLQQADTLGFIFKSYQLTFTPFLTAYLFGARVTNTMLNEARYVQTDGTNWWAPSGSNLYLNGAETVSDARQRFYLPVAVEDAFGEKTRLTYDAYSLLLIQTEDPLHNKTVAEAIDYRILQVARIKDMNNNFGEIISDELGMVIATSVYGKESDGIHGDAPLSAYNIIAPADLAEVITDPQKFLQQATSFFYYDLFSWMDRAQPVCFANAARETHISELQEGQSSRVFSSVAYLNGMQQTLQMKLQAEPGIALQWQNGSIVQTDTTPGLRWVGNGRTILNNKGNPVKQYEPFFSTTYQYESEKQLVEIGFSDILYYDAIGRNIRITHANGSFIKTEFDAWQQLAYDENDMVLQSQWYADRGNPNPLSPEPADPETRAAWLTAKQADTPLQLHLDSLGRTIYTIADNGALGKYATQSVLDIEGNQRAVVDARNNTVMQFRYDMTGRKVYQEAMDSGERWTFRDALDKPVYAWDSRDHRFRSEYDKLSRPVKQWLTESVTTSSPEKMTGLNVYGEGQPNDTLLNLRGKLFESFDQSGMTQTTEYDFKGNTKSSFKQLAADYKNIVDWNIVNPATLLDPEIFSGASRFNAVNKHIETVLPDGSKLLPEYNDANLLKQINVFIQGQNTTVPFVQNIDYNAKARREKILYGNNTVSNYTYDERTYHLIRLLTTRNKGADILQDLNYTYDPVKNIIQIQDKAQQTIFFNNAGVDPGNKFEYDALYRLTRAVGREHAGTNAASDQFDTDKTLNGGGRRLTLKGDMNAMQQYQELYQYDEVGNMLEMVHNAGNGIFQNKWTRIFTCNAGNNQLIKTQTGAAVANYSYDAHGNMQGLQNGSFDISWNYADQLQQIDLGGGGIAYYVYDGAGSRVRKVIENGGLIKDRIYIGNYEVYRKRQGNAIEMERQTLHIMDDRQRIALVETRTQGTDAGLAFLTRYQYGNHLNTVCLEMDGDANNPNIISYEEYYPFGSTAYQATHNQTETAKRYRYTGKERDEESGLYYHGARYYAPWLAR